MNINGDFEFLRSDYGHLWMWSLLEVYYRQKFLLSHTCCQDFGLSGFWPCWDFGNVGILACLDFSLVGISAMLGFSACWDFGSAGLWPVGILTMLGFWVVRILSIGILACWDYDLDPKIHCIKKFIGILESKLHIVSKTYRVTLIQAVLEQEKIKFWRRENYFCSR